MTFNVGNKSADNDNVFIFKRRSKRTEFAGQNKAFPFYNHLV